MTDESLRAMATTFARLGQELTDTASTSPFDALTQLAVRRIPGADSASVPTYRHGQFTTVAATDDRARRADALQYMLGSGPCVDAILEEVPSNPEDLRHDPRWPDYGTRAHEELGWSSMLSFRLNHEPLADELIAGLNIYSTRTAAFDEDAQQNGLLVATHGALIIAARMYQERAEHLQRALETSREIGIAMGVLMAQRRFTREQAFDLLRIASQRTNRKLHDIATDVADTGALPLRTRCPHR
jgi:hypothetical protein